MDKESIYTKWQNQATQLFCKRVAELMVERGMTRQHLAERLGCSVTALPFNRPEGDYSPSVLRMLEYAKILNVPVWETIYDCGISTLKAGGTPMNVTWQTQDELNARLTMLIKKRKTNLRKIAANVGTSHQVISANLKSNNMSLAILFRLAAGIGVEPWELLIDREDMEREVRRRKGVTEGVQDIQRDEPSVKESMQQTQNKASGTVAEPESGLPWDDVEEAREADKRLSAIPLRVIKIIRCPYCNNEISIKE